MNHHGSDTYDLSTTPIFLVSGGLNICSCYVLVKHDRPTRQLAHAEHKTDEKDGRCSGPEATSDTCLAPDDDLPPEYWQALLENANAEIEPSGSSMVALRLTEIPQHLLRVSCRRCSRTVEIQKVDAIRLYGQHAVWKNVGQRLMDDTCTQRKGRHEEDGCWPFYGVS